MVLLDHGLYEELSLNVRQSLCLLWKSIVLGDHPRMKKHAAELGVTGWQFFFLCLLKHVHLRKTFQLVAAVIEQNAIQEL